MSAPTYADFIADPLRKENTVVIVNGYDRIALVERTYYFTKRDFSTGPTETPASQLFDRRVIGRFERTTSTIGSEGGVRSLAGLVPMQTVGLVRLKQFFGDLDTGAAACLQGTPLRFVSFGGRSIQVLHGGECSKGVLPLANYRTMTKGVVTGEPSIGKSDVEFKVQGQDERARYPVQDRLFTGTDRCLIFDGSTAEVDCGTDAAFNFTSGAFSYGSLALVEAYPAAEQTILCRGGLNVAGYQIRLTTAGEIRVVTSQSGASQSTYSDPIPLGKVFEWGISRNGAAVAIFFDGDDAVATAGTHVNPASTSSHLYFGRNDAGTVHFEGMLDEIRCRGTFTAEDEFEEMMLRPLDPAEYSTFLGYWPCDDGFGSGVATLDNLGTVGSAADGAVTGGFFASTCNGLADMAGRVMPSVWGEYSGFAPVCVDVARQVYCVHGAATEEISTIRLGGRESYNRIVDGDASGDDYTSWLDFSIATTADGAVDTCIFPGGTLFRIGGEPNYKLTVAGKGDKSDGTYRNTVGAICRYVLTTAGQQPFDDATEIYDAAWDDFEAANDAVVNYTFTDERTVEQMVADLCRTYHAAVWPRRSDGKLSIKQIGNPQTETPVVTLTRNHVGRGTLVPQERGTPFTRWIFRYAENPTVMGNGVLYESLGTEDPAQAAFARLRWRKSERRSPAIKRIFKDAGVYDVETRFVHLADTQTEKARFASLTNEPDQGFIFTCRPPGIELDLFDVVVFDYQDRDGRRRLQQRFGTHDDARFYICGISDLEGGTFELYPWRPKVV